MVDPLAAAIISRPSAARVLKSALNSMARSKRTHPTDLFSLLPPRRKGKERAVEPLAFECNQCWSLLPHTISSFFSRHSPWCPIRNRLFMTNQVIPRRSQPFPQPSHRTRRHSSSAARTVTSQTRLLDWPQNIRPSHEPQEPADTLHSLLSAGTPFDPEHAWRVYKASIRADAKLTPEAQLRFIQRLFDSFQLCGDTVPDLPLLHTWGTRLEPLLRVLESSLEDGSPEMISLRCFTAQVHAWLGNLAQASRLAGEIRASWLNHPQRSTLLSVYRDILVLSRYHHDPSYALDLLIREWKFLGSICRARTSSLVQATSFRKAIHNILADIPNGALLLSRSKMDLDDRSRLGELFLETYCAKKLLYQAHALVLEMRKQQLPVRFHLETKLARFLAQDDLFTLAHEIFTAINPSTDPQLYHSTGLHLYARCGDVDRAEEFFSKHDDNNWSMPVARCMLMHAYAIAGKAEKVVELFHGFFPTTSDGNFLAERPGIQHYTTVILAYAEQANFVGIDFWLEKMLEAGCRPDGHVYSIILQSFARHGDIDSVATLFDQMRAADVKLDCAHYTSVVALLARRKDVAAAEMFYLQALHDGITPDRMMITSLMNAHVEAGSWEGVVRIFDYLQQSSPFRRGLSIEVYNTLLKAYVLIGTPFRVVHTMFRKLVQAGVRPDGYAYAWVIQSACDAGKMNIAEELFAEMEKKQSGDPPCHLDAYVLTIIMAGHVRQRSKTRARACYEDIQRRGIKPNSITYKQILQAYANDRTEESLKVAESFLEQIMEADVDDPSWTGSESRASALGNIHSPLMLVYAQKEKPEEVVRLFNRMLEAGGESSLESLTIILDVHRRTDNIDAVRQLWPQIWTLALRLSCANKLFKGDDTSMPMLRRRSNLLCMPLSIYIDALSTVGEHHAVLDTWTKAKAEGFSFDAHNWNHLAVALVRAGELDRAFEVLERVLIPYSRKNPVARDPFPESPIVFDMMASDVDMPAPDAPMRDKARRAKAVKRTTNALRSILPMSDESTDFAHPLHILHQVIPGLSMWRPHAVTLRLLSKVLGHLQRGRLVQPRVRADNTPPAASRDYADSESQLDIASATLQRIYHNYPEAVRAVLLYERGQARREAGQRSPKQWIKVKQQAVDTSADGDTIGLRG